MRKALIGLAIVLALYLLIVLIAGRGPHVDIPADARIGQEYVGENEAAVIERTQNLILDQMRSRYGDDDTALRDAHPKAHGCVQADFQILDGLDEHYRYGLFAAPRSYHAWIRFSNGSLVPQPDAKGDVRGMAIKLTGVPGPKLMPDENQTQDFLLINHPVLPVGDPGEYADLFDLAFQGRPMSYMFSLNPFAWKLGALSEIIAIRTKKIPSMLGIRYWSTTPYRWANNGAVKYSARPCEASTATVPDDPTDNYLREVMIAHLEGRDACFEFMVQPQTDAVAMPIEDPAVEWSEQLSPFVPVARIVIPVQNFATAPQDQFCEDLSFSPWHSVAAHQPLGGINRVRKSVYLAISAHRHQHNLREPIEPTGEERFD
ncbi:MAG: catalase family protein [Spirochaetales bacterium]|nr:catalase family protein [Leptospiraceae bacterium]MCP5480981.1 catalase family protein [Spirochaetales bacterium]MCP5485361.1 catalase family protein [Spirochaetales bacterium]